MSLPSGPPMAGGGPIVSEGGPIGATGGGVRLRPCTGGISWALHMLYSKKKIMCEVQSFKRTYAKFDVVSILRRF